MAMPCCAWTRRFRGVGLAIRRPASRVRSNPWRLPARSIRFISVATCSRPTLNPCLTPAGPATSGCPQRGTPCAACPLSAFALQTLGRATDPVHQRQIGIRDRARLIKDTAPADPRKLTPGSISDPPHTLNAGLWFRRGRLVMVISSLAASCCQIAGNLIHRIKCWPGSYTENPPIPAVQFPRTTSLVLK